MQATAGSLFGKEERCGVVGYSMGMPPFQKEPQGAAFNDRWRYLRVRSGQTSIHALVQ